MCSFLPVLADKGLFFAILIAIIGLTDVLDGFLARRFKCTSRTGAMLDSIADMVFFMVIMIVLWVFYQSLIKEWWVMLTVAAGIRLGSTCINLIRFRKFVFIHTYANKLAGFLIYIDLLLLPLYPKIDINCIVLIIAIVAAVEEFLIITMSKDIDENRKSIFF